MNKYKMLLSALALAILLAPASSYAESVESDDIQIDILSDTEPYEMMEEDEALDDSESMNEYENPYEYEEDPENIE